MADHNPTTASPQSDHSSTYEAVETRVKRESVYTELNNPQSLSGDEGLMTGQKGGTEDDDGDGGEAADYYYIRDGSADINTTAPFPGVRHEPASLHSTASSTTAATTAATITVITATVSPDTLVTVIDTRNQENGTTETDQGDGYLYPLSVQLPIQQ